MKLNKLVRNITRQEAVNFVANGSKNIVAVFEGESYLVNSYNIFDKDEALFYFVDYQQLDVIKLIDQLRRGEDDYARVSYNLHKQEVFTSLKTTKYSI